MKILVTGGPVHAHLDSVKMITNRFKGGLMAKLVVDLCELGHDVTFIVPRIAIPALHHEGAEVLLHDGIESYREMVLAEAPKHDGVVLGAAVANLIPLDPIKGKFPSHNYKPGDVIPINFTIAPRIIDDVKKVAPQMKLFGFKLLTGVSQEELVDAAYGVLLESKATAVFANQTADLKAVQIVTRERGTIPLHRDSLAEFIINCTADKYYRSSVTPMIDTPRSLELMEREFHALAREYSSKFPVNKEGYMFGTIAVRSPDSNSPGVFLTTGRGKNELEDRVIVTRVDHVSRTVHTFDKKATLNAPLLSLLFKWTNCNSIVHYHDQIPAAPTLEYAPAGTIRDAARFLARAIPSQFNIEGHGCFILQ